MNQAIISLERVLQTLKDGYENEKQFLKYWQLKYEDIKNIDLKNVNKLQELIRMIIEYESRKKIYETAIDIVENEIMCVKFFEGGEDNE